MSAQIPLRWSWPCEFFLGTHRPHWLHPGKSRILAPSGPLFVSARRLRDRRSPYPRCDIDFAVDSGGFTELSKFGRWTIGAAGYAEQMLLLAEQTGRLRWAAIQDWMCEPWVIDGGTGPNGGKPSPGTKLSVLEHQVRTVQSLLDLRTLAPSIPWVPVVQGQTVDDYFRHVEMYAQAGVDLRGEPLVGAGSVCRRQATAEIALLLRSLAGYGLKLHGFGVKLGGLDISAPYLVSADSMAWSFAARKRGRPRDANCQRWAEEWRREVLERIGSRSQ
jgi:hypothetical protein